MKSTVQREQDISIFNTFIHPQAATKVLQVLESGRLSEGEVVKQFEHELELIGLKSPVTVNSGSAALQLALMQAGIGAGDEVICPAQTFVATGLAVLMQGAQPVFCDIQLDTGNLDPADLDARFTPRTKAVIPVHWAGYPCDIDEINEACRARNVIVIEDAAHALGASYKNQMIGSLSDFACFSFQAIKHVTTGDGGAVTCQSAETRKQLKSRRWFGIDRDSAEPSELGERVYNIDRLGFKFHLNDYAAALGIANLIGFRERLLQRSRVAALYREELGKLGGIRLFRSDSDRQSAHWIFGLHVERRNDFVRALKERKVIASVVHQRIDRNSIFGGLRDLPNQVQFDQSQIHLPIHDAIDLEEAAYIVECIKSGW